MRTDPVAMSWLAVVSDGSVPFENRWDINRLYAADVPGPPHRVPYDGASMGLCISETARS